MLGVVIDISAILCCFYGTDVSFTFARRFLMKKGMYIIIMTCITAMSVLFGQPTQTAVAGEIQSVYSNEYNSAGVTELEVGDDTVDIYYLSDAYSDNVTIPDSYNTAYQITASGMTGDLSYQVTYGYAAKVSDTGLIEPYFWVSESTQKKTYYSGTAKISVSDGTSTKVITVNVHDYAPIYVKEVEDTFVRENITDDMSDYDKLKKITEYVAHTYDYSAYYSSATGMIMSGGGDCWASCDLIMDLCSMTGLETYLRVANQDAGAGSGHRNVIVLCDGKIYIADAGYSGTAPRNYSLYETDGFSIRNSTMYQYDGFDTDITVPSTVKYLGRSGCNVFYYAPKRDTITSVTLPSSVMYISEYAFSGLTNLKTITVDSANETYKSIDGIVYSKDGKTVCVVPNGKTSVKIPSGVTTIDKYSFYYNSKLTSVDIPDTVTTISEGAFGTCTSLSTVTVPSTVTSIGDYAFYSGVKKLIVLSPNATFGSKVFAASYTTTGYTMVGFAGSTAESYAKANNITFITLDDDGYYIGDVDGKSCVLTAVGDIAIFTGLRNVNGVLTYFKQGILCTDTALVSYNDKTYYVKDGKAASYTGLVKYSGKYYYVKNGTVCKDKTLVKYGGKYYYVKNGTVCKTTAIVKLNKKYYYVKKGIWQKKTSAVLKFGKKTYYIKSGKVAVSFTGRKNYKGHVYYIKKGVVSKKIK